MGMIRVLYVDDELDLLEIVKVYLEESGDIRVDTVPSASEAEKALATDQYDAVISDYQMPVMTGVEFLHRLRLAGSKVPFILYTGRGREEVVIEALNLGADFYMQKGGSPLAQFAELEHYVRQGVQRYRAEKAKRESEEHFRSLVEHSFEGIGVHIDRKLIEVNKAFSDITGYSREELIGKDISELFTPESMAVMAEKLKQPFADPYDARLVLKDGRIVDVKTRGKNIEWDGRMARLGTILDLSSREDMEKLRERDNLLRTIVEATPDMVWEIDPQGMFTYMSPKIADILGYVPEDVIGKPVFALTSPLTMEWAQITLASLVEMPMTRTAKFEMSATHANGSEVRLEIRSSPFWDADGNLKGFRGIARDVTERKLVENALHKSERQFESLFEQSPLAISIHDKDGRLVDINPAGVSMFGLKNKSQLVGTSLFDSPFMSKEIASALMEGKIAHNKVQVDLKKQDEPALFSESKRDSMWVDVTVIPLYDEALSLSGYEAQVRDLSESRMARELEMEQDALLSAILEGSPDVIMLALDREYRYLAFNKLHFETMKRIWGREIVVGMDMLNDVVGMESDRQKAKVNFDRALSGESFTITEEYGDTALERLTWQDYYSPITFADGAIIGVTVFCLNITERERAKYVMQDANNKLRIITSITRHDMLNKLTALYSYLELDRRRAANPAMADHLDKMVQITKTMVSQINFMKEYQDIGLVMPEWQSVNDVCTYAREHLDPSDLEVDLQAGDLEVYADPMLNKVFYNLMDNSMKHGQHVRRIVIRYERTGDGLIIVYEDDGVGISAKDKPQLFVEAAGKKHGLGLFLAKEILKITGIAISEDGEPGKGARFVIQVPPGKFRFKETTPESP